METEKQKDDPWAPSFLMVEAEIVAPKIRGHGENIPLTSSSQPRAVGRRQEENLGIQMGTRR